MESHSLTIEIREGRGKGGCRKARRAGKLPGIVYGLGHNIPVNLDPRVIQKYLLQEGGRNLVFDLHGKDVEGRSALIKDYQVDPLSRKLLHVDLLEIDTSKKVDVTVPLNFIGKAIGVGSGGVLNFVERTIDIRCLPNRIPKHIDVDVTPLEIGDSIHLDQLALPEGVEKTSHSNSTLVTCVPPTKEEDAVASLAPSAEPEVITEKKPAEGEAGDKDKDKK